MKAEIIKELFEKFESVASDLDGVECWSARDLYPLFGYSQWRGFQDAINRAKESCKNASGDIMSNFADIRKIVKTGVAEKEIDDSRGFAQLHSKGDSDMFWNKHISEYQNRDEVDSFYLDFL